jgi:hypothetical protein
MTNNGRTNDTNFDPLAPTWGKTVTDPLGTVYMTLSSSNGVRLYNLFGARQSHVAARRGWSELENNFAQISASVSHVTVTDTSFKIETFLTRDLDKPYDSFEIIKSAGANFRLTRPLPPPPDKPSFPMPEPGSTYYLPNLQWTAGENYNFKIPDDDLMKDQPEYVMLVGNHGASADTFWGWTTSNPLMDLSQFGGKPVEFDLRFPTQAMITGLNQIIIVVQSLTGGDQEVILQVEGGSSGIIVNEWFTAKGILPASLRLTDISKFRLRMTFTNYNPNDLEGSSTAFTRDKVFHVKDLRFIWLE